MAHLAAALAQQAATCVTKCFAALAGAACALPADVMCAAADGPAALYEMLTAALAPVSLFLSSLQDCWCHLPHARASLLSSCSLV